MILETDDDFKKEVRYSLTAGLFGGFGSLCSTFAYSVFLKDDCAFVDDHTSVFQSMRIRYFLINMSILLMLLCWRVTMVYHTSALRICATMEGASIMTGLVNALISILLGYLIYNDTSSTMYSAIGGLVAQTIGFYHFYFDDWDSWVALNEYRLYVKMNIRRDRRKRRSGGF